MRGRFRLHGAGTGGPGRTHVAARPVTQDAPRSTDEPACLLIQLIANGHTPAQAEAHVARMRAWQQAPVSSVNSFCRANARLWDEIVANNPTPWHRSMARAAAHGHRHA